MPPPRVCLSQVLDKMERTGFNKLANPGDDHVDPLAKILAGKSAAFQGKARKEMAALSDLHKAHRPGRG